MQTVGLTGDKPNNVQTVGLTGDIPSDVQTLGLTGDNPNDVQTVGLTGDNLTDVQTVGLTGDNLTDVQTVGLTGDNLTDVQSAGFRAVLQWSLVASSEDGRRTGVSCHGWSTSATLPVAGPSWTIDTSSLRHTASGQSYFTLPVSHGAHCFQPVIAHFRAIVGNTASSQS